MCGICGAVDQSLTGQLVEVVDEMNQKLVHRGPDDSGTWGARSVAIGMRRLSIIDLAGGHQPITNEDDSLVIVFNGEIYNFAELRNELLEKGHQFKTQSDTEVILHLYEEYGTSAPRHLKGMFAFCIYDKRRDLLFLARDRFGEKPLFYWHHRDKFYFSSEIPSLLQSGSVPRELDQEALYYYMRYRLVPTPLTMFHEIRQLPAGHWMRFKQGQLTLEPFFQIRFQVNAELEDEEAAKHQVKQAVLNAVSRQRVSDVPIGAFLSGGIDSSTVVAALQSQSNRPIDTFTMRFEHAPYDESPIARRVAEHLGTRHHEMVISNSGFHPDDLWRIIRHVGQPFADSSAIPTYVISREIREHVTVCLSGDGGDEMFGGYGYFKHCLNIDRIASFAPRAAFRLMESTVRQMGKLPLMKKWALLRAVRQVASVASLPPQDRLWNIAPLFDLRELDRLVHSSIASQLLAQESSRLAALMEPPHSHSRLRDVMKHRMSFQLPEDMLVKVDRMSMAASLEVRAPLLDVEVAEVAASLPDRHLIRNGTTKYILREAFRDMLPDEVYSHPKWGFSIPLHKYQNQQYHDTCRELLLGDQNSVVRSLFNRPYLEMIVDRGLNRQFDGADVSVFRSSHQVWALLQLAAWASHFSVSA